MAGWGLWSYGVGVRYTKIDERGEILWDPVKRGLYEFFNVFSKKLTQ